MKALVVLAFSAYLTLCIWALLEGWKYVGR